MVEWPAGSQIFWYNNEIGGFGTTPINTDEPGIDPHWKECKIGGIQSGPCSEFEGSIGNEVWSPSSVVVVGNVYEYHRHTANCDHRRLSWCDDPDVNYPSQEKHCHPRKHESWKTRFCY